MTLAEWRNLAVAAIQKAVAEPIKVQGHGGRFTIDGLKRHALQGPTVLVSCLGIPTLRVDPRGVVATCSCAAFAVTGDRPQLPRDVGALAMVTVLAKALPDNNFEGDDLDGARRVRADNLFSRELDAEGVALWAVSWQQDVLLSDMDPATLDLFDTFHADIDLAPPDGSIEMEAHVDNLYP